MPRRTSPKFLFSALYFSEGAPIGFLWWALPALLRERGIPVEEITSLTGFLVIPWAFKFLWAPLIDTWQTPRWTLRSWILSAQFVMGLSLLPLLLPDIAGDFRIVSLFLILHAVSAATQDAAVDALAINSIPPSDRGSVNGWMQAGMLAGRGLLGGGALVIADLAGEIAVVPVLVLAIWVPMILLFVNKPSASGRTGHVSGGGHLVEKIRHSLFDRKVFAGLLFALVAGAGFEGAGALAGPLLVDRNFSKSEIGFFFGVVVIASMILGSIAGGRLADRKGKARATMLSLLLVSAAIFSLAIAVSIHDPGWMVMSVLGLLYVGIGLFTAASYSLFMDLADSPMAATRFSAFMGATNGCEAWATFSAGRIAGAYGYSFSFLLLPVLSLLSLPILRSLGARTPQTGHEGIQTIMNDEGAQHES